MAELKTRLTWGRGAAALTLALFVVPAAAGASIYDCGASGTQPFVVSVDGAVCMIDADATVAAEVSPLECHYEPPALKVFNLNSDMTYTITDEGLQVASGVCALRQ